MKKTLVEVSPAQGCRSRIAKNFLRILAVVAIMSTSLTEGMCANMRRPVTPKASKEARALLAYLYSIQGDKVLAGQHGGVTDVEYAKGVTGRYPAIMGLDLIHENKNEEVIQQAKDWWAKGGIPTVMWHWGAPSQGPGYENSKKEIDIDKCFQKGTAEYEAFWADLKRIADHLTVLRDAGVPIIWRPLHECDGDWFWYGKGTGEQFCRVWRTMFDYFAKERKLNNLIWVLGHCGDPLPEFDPGEQYYDIVGADAYANDRVRKGMYTTLKSIHGNDIPVCYHECGTVPDPDLCAEQGVYWTWWMLWSGSHARAHDTAELKRIYSLDNILTLDELPSIMDYLPKNKAYKSSKK